LGLDEQGKEQYFFLTPSKYSSEMSSLTGEVMDGVSKSMVATSSKSWGVHTVVVGIGLSGELQAGPLKVAAEPRLRFIFLTKLSLIFPSFQKGLI